MCRKCVHHGKVHFILAEGDGFKPTSNVCTDRSQLDSEVMKAQQR